MHPLVQVYADFEAITDDEGKQTPILVCFETDESDETVVCEGPHCMDLLFLNSMYSPRIKMVLFLNLKGYDGMFLLQYCYDNQLEVKDQITVGTKITI